MPSLFSRYNKVGVDGPINPDQSEKRSGLLGGQGGQDADVTSNTSTLADKAGGPLVNTSNDKNALTWTDRYGWIPSNKYTFREGESVPLVTVRCLGSGSLGLVEEVKSNAIVYAETHPNPIYTTLVRKRFQLPSPKVSRAKRLEVIEQEVQTLKRLSHPHTASLIGSYDEIQGKRMFVSILMEPVGESNLADFLSRIEAGIDDGENAIPVDRTHRAWLRMWMGCLASGLEYLHANHIRHEDIKPSNIVQRGDRVLFIDFSSANFFETIHTATESLVRSSRPYSAPEVLDKVQSDGLLLKHGRGTDIFSLGCVFMEMLAVISKSRLHDFQTFCSEEDGQLLYAHQLKRTANWFQRVDLHDPQSQRVYRDLVAPMLAEDRADRPSSHAVVQKYMEIETNDVSWKELRCRYNCLKRPE